MNEIKLLNIQKQYFNKNIYDVKNELNGLLPVNKNRNKERTYNKKDVF